MSSSNRINYDPLMGGGGLGSYNQGDHIAVDTLRIGGTVITEADLAKFHKLVGFMDFALGASEELRNLMVAYEAKQRILK